MISTKLALAILVLAALQVSTLGQFDKKAPPVVWDRTVKRLDLGLVHYSIILHTTSPCSILGKYSMPAQRDPPMRDNQFERVQIFCDMNYNKTLSKMESITDLWKGKQIQTYRTKRSTGVVLRKKRFILGFIAGYFISNLVNTIIDRIFPDTHIEALMHNEELMNEKIRALNEQVQVQTPLQQQTVNLLDELHKEVKKLDERTLIFQKWYPQLAWTYSALLLKMDKRMNDLERIRESLVDDKLDIPAIKSMLNSTWLDEVFSETAQLIDFSHLGGGKLKIEFFAQKRAADMKAYKVKAIKYWNFLSDPPTLLEYAGAEYLAINVTNRCVVGLPTLVRNYVSAECTTTDWKDPNLRLWRPVRNVTWTPNNTPSSYIEGYPDNLIYCIGHNITINGITAKCPSYPFRLNFDISWKTEDLVYDAKLVQRDETEHMIQPTYEIDNVHGAESLSNDHTGASLEKLRELSNKLSELQKKTQAVDVVLERPESLREMENQKQTVNPEGLTYN